MIEDKHAYHQQAYLWISVALLMPVLLWPSFLLFGFTPAFGIRIEQNWVIAASCLLMVAVVADSILAYQQRLIDVVIAAIWIMLVSSTISVAIRDESAVWFLAFLFFLRTLHSLYQLWQNKLHSWWQWIAWSRDSSAAASIFLWLYYWPK